MTPTPETTTPTPTGKDRRRHQRIPRSRELAVFQFADERERPGLVRGRLADISGGGAALRTMTDPPPKGAVGQVIAYFEGFKFVSEARVVRTWSDGFALEFLEVGPTDQEFLTGLTNDDVIGL